MRQRHIARIWLIVRVGRRLVDLRELLPDRRITMNPVAVNVGHTVSMSIVWLDQNGNPMLTTPVPDAPPAWTDTTPSTGTLTVAPGGMTATELAIAAGTDTVDLSLSVGGEAFSASLGITVSAAAQVLTSVSIAATVS